MPGLRGATEHVDELAAEMGVLVRREKPRDARKKAYLGGRPRILIGGVNSDVDYFTALHELGHHAIGDYGPDRLLEEEADAWKWAINHARWEPSAVVKRMIGTKLKSYVDHASGKRSNRPPAGHIFHKMLAWGEQYKPRPKRRERRLP